jgi:hypothetical protein
LAATGQELEPAKLPKGALEAVLSDDGTVLAAVDKDGAVTLSDRATGKARGKVPAAAKDAVAGLAFSPDGKTLAAFWSRDKRITLHDAAGKQTGVVPTQGVNGEVFDDVAFGEGPRPILFYSADSRRLAVRDAPRSLGVFDARTGRRLHKLTLAGKVGPRCGAFSPDGRTVALQFGTTQVRLYELATEGVRDEFGKPPPEPNAERAQQGLAVGLGVGFFSGPLTSAPIAFAPDGRTLALGMGSEVRLLDFTTGKTVKTLTGHRGTVQALAFGPGGKTLVSASADTTGLVWNVAGVNPVPTPLRPEGQQLADAWEQLLSDDAAKAGAALRLLTAAPTQSVPLLAKALRPVPSVEAKQLARLIEDLDRPEFKTRSQAEAELTKLGELAQPALRRALDRGPSLETRRRLEAVLAKTQVTVLKGEKLRNYRAVEVLERIGSAEARELLATLAGGAPGAVVTEAALEAQRRFQARRQQP